MPVFPVNKTILLFFSIFCCIASLFGQVNTNNPVNLSDTSEALLKKEISFHFNSGPLKQALAKLSSENSLKIVYSDNNIINTTTSSCAFERASVAQVLDFLLTNSSLDYMVIGKVIVIIPKKTQTPTNDTAKSVNKQEQKIQQHIYSASYNQNHFQTLPKDIRRILEKTYKKELQIAKKNKISKDSLDKQEKQKSYIPGPKTSFSADLQLGIQAFPNSFRSVTSTDSFKIYPSIKVPVKAFFQASAGYNLTKKYRLATGIAYTSFDVIYQSETTEKKGKPGKSPSHTTDNYTTEYKTDTVKYHHISLPLCLEYIVINNMYFFGITTSVNNAIIISKSENPAFQKVSNEKKTRLTTCLATGLSGGVNINSYTIGTTIRYSVALFPLIKTAHYTYSAGQLNWSLFVRYNW